jgi:hypothetical protein
MKPTKPKDATRHLRLKKEKVKELQPRQLDNVVGGCIQPCWNSYGTGTGN